MEQRSFVRTSMGAIEVDISDRVGFSTGTLKDVSRFGVCVTDIPRKLQTENSIFTAIISANGQRFKLQLKEKWKKQDGLTMVMGAKIKDAPWDWTEMVKQLEPENEDVWATT